MAVKSRTINITKEEIEFQVAVDIANNLIRRFAEGIVEKVCYSLKDKGKNWEVDALKGVNDGLIIAEIELNSEDESFELPEWIDKEVSDDNRYFNSILAQNPVNKWQNK